MLKTLVLIVSFDVSRKGGIESLTHQVHLSLSEQGIRSVVVSPRRLGRGQVGRVLGSLHFFLRLFYYLPRTYKILCMHSLMIRPLSLLGVFGFNKKPVYCWVHGIEVWGSALKEVKRGLLKCRGIIASSTFTRDRMLEQLSDAPLTFVVNPTSDKAKILGDLDRSITSDSRFVLVTIARMDPNERYKGHDVIIDALTQIKMNGESIERFEWRVIGEGNDLIRLKQRVAGLKLDKIVTFTGMISDQDLSSELALADLLIMPSRYEVRDDGCACGEGFGIVYLEAAYAGVPSVACIEGGQTDFIINDQTGWLVKQDPSEIAALLSRLSKDRELVLKMGRSAKTRAVDEFGPFSFSKRLIDALELNNSC